MNLELIKLLYKKRKHIIIITIIGAVITAGMSYLITPKFKSVGAVFPTNIGQYSEESPTENLMQFITSKEVRDMVLKRFDLAEHYGLDSNDAKFQTYFIYMFEENVKISQTRYESVQIEVLDKDPVMSQKLVYGIVDATNDHIRNCIDSKSIELIDMHRQYTASKIRRIDSVGNILRKMSEDYGILDYFIQTEQASKSYYKALPTGKVGKLDDVMRHLGEKGLLYMNLMEQYKSDILYFNESRQEMDKAIRDVKKKFTYTTFASAPNLPEVKSTPKRGIMTAIGAVGSLLFACLFFILSDRFKKIKQELA